MAQRVIPLSVIEHRVVEIDESIRSLQVERGMLMRLKSSAVSVSGEADATPAGQQTVINLANDGQPRRMGATESIRVALREHPGLRPKEVVDQIEHNVGTKSGDVRKMLYNVLASLQKRGKLAKDNKGKLYLPMG